MYVEEISVLHQNIAWVHETANYCYYVTPINSLYAAESQVQTLKDTLRQLILDINMPGYILIRPHRIDSAAILSYHHQQYLKNGFPELAELEREHLDDLAKILNESVRYKYSICFVFTDGRDELKRKRPISHIMGIKSTTPPSDMKEYFIAVEEEIFKKLNGVLETKRLDATQISDLCNYLAVPIEQLFEDYYVEPHPSELEFNVKLNNSMDFQKVFSRVLSVPYFDEDVIGENHTNLAVNHLQLGSFPVDTIIKFDLEHTAKFRQAMTGKKEEIDKKARRYHQSSNRRDIEAEKAKIIAIAASEVDPSIEQSKMLWQMFFRLRAGTIDLLNRRTEYLMRRMRSSKINLSYELGDQEHLHNHLFPYKNTFFRYIQTTDVSYFAHFNFLGGLMIGEEENGLFLTSTNPGKIPVQWNPSAPIEGMSQTSSSAIAFVGSTGAGKSQQANNCALLIMLYHGAPVLCIDPKNDRSKLIELLNHYHCPTRKLVIGSAECPSGMFDPYILYPNDPQKALDQAYRDIISFTRAINPDDRISLQAIQEAAREMDKSIELGVYKRRTFTFLIEHLRKSQPLIYQTLVALKDDFYARLFFADETTDYSDAFNFGAPFNLITFERLPLLDNKTNQIRFDPNQMEHRIFSILISRTNEICNSFMRLFPNREKVIIFEEQRVWSAIEGGQKVIDHVVRQGRSHFVHTFIISQALSEIDEQILNNVGQMFIGSLASKQEIEYISHFLGVEKHIHILNALKDHTKDEGRQEAKKYNMVYVDYNNRKCVVRMQIPDLFKQAFYTYKPKVPVTGTFQVVDSDEVQA